MVDTSNVHDVHEKSTPDIIPTIIDTIKLNLKISLQELAGLTVKSKRTIQRILKDSDQKNDPERLALVNYRQKILLTPLSYFLFFLTNEVILLKLNLHTFIRKNYSKYLKAISSINCSPFLRLNTRHFFDFGCQT